MQRVSRIAGGFFSTVLCAAIASGADGQTPEHLRSRIYVYDLRHHSSRLLFQDDSIWEAPNWSPDGRSLIVNHAGGIYRLPLKKAQPARLAIPAELNCNNDKALSPHGDRLAFSASSPSSQGSEVYLADADGSNSKQMTSASPSYFHGWSPDGTTLAFVAQRGGSGQYDIYAMPAQGGAETRLTADPHQDDGPDYSPDGKWIYINSDRSGKEAVWRFPAGGAGPEDRSAQQAISDELQDWFPHISPDGTKMVYVGYPAGTPTHNPRDAAIEIRMADIDRGTVGNQRETLVKATGGQGTMNVNSWAPDSRHFAYVTYEKLP